MKVYLKKYIYLFICIILVLFLTKIIDTMAITDETEIKFKDINMYNAVVEQLEHVDNIQKDSSNYSIIIKNNDLSEITKLELNNNNISQISGLEKFTELTELKINNNNITDISCLSSLTKLTKLYAEGNTISDLTPISGLNNLEYLNIAKNKLADPADNSENSVTNKISSLTNLKELDISHNYLRYTNGLNNITNLTKLNLYDNVIHDLTGLSTLTNLEELNLGENNEIKPYDNITGLESLNNLINLKYFNFSENKTADIINYISNMVNLENLSLQGNLITDVTNLSTLTKLKILNLYDNSIKTFSSELHNLVELEELILGKNSLKNLKNFCTNINDENSIVWKNLKKIDLSGNKYIYTIFAGEQSNNDTVRIDTNAKVIEILKNCVNELNYEYITDTSNLPHYDNDGVPYVTYDDFEAKCDGIYDDFIAIRNAHIFANEYGYDVRATEGKTYHIFKYYESSVIVKTNTDWKNANFIIHDEEIEEVSGRYDYIFNVTNITEDITTINNPNWTIGIETKQILELSDELEVLNEKGYKTYLCVPVNSNKKQYIRYGSNENSGSNQQDYFIIDKEGKVLNDIQWDFEEITTFTIYPIPNTSISIKNGNFISNAVSSQGETTYVNLKKNAYFERNIWIHMAANIEVSGINYRLSYEPDKDEMSGSYKGFIHTRIVANLEIKDCSLFTRKYSINGRSTYGLNMSGNVNVICKNITSNNINDPHRWGLVGTYYCKDVIFENCTLNRIDAHQGIYNLLVKDCNIGIKGLVLTGQGALNVINTTVEATAFISLREDYGSTWNGDVNIVDCTYKYDGIYAPRLLGTVLAYDNNMLHDFGYDCKIPNINVNNLKIDMQNNNKYNYFYIMHIAGIKSEEDYIENTTEYLKNYLPQNININNFSFINCSVDCDMNISNESLTPYLNDYNYVITNAKLTKENSDEDIIRETNTDNYFTNNKLCFEITKNNSTQNNVSLYRDGHAIIENQPIDDMYSYTFSEDGKYKIKMSSLENFNNYIGEKSYEFSIDTEKPEIVGVEEGKKYQKATPIISDENLETIILTKNGETQENYKNGDEISKEGNYVLTVTDKAKNMTIVNFEIFVKAVQSIKIKTNPTKTSYIQDYENLDLTGGVLEVEYNDGTTDEISLTNEKIKVTGFDNSKIGTTTITVEYEGKTTTFDIEIISKQVSKIEIGKVPTKTKYIQNYESLDLTGGSLTVEYNDETTDTISLTNEKVKVTGFDNSKIGTTTITVEYEGKTTTFDVEIISKQISKIEIGKVPTKVNYIQNNENLDLTGGVIIVEYDDKTTDTISLTNEKIKITGFDNSKIGTTIITVEYEGKTTTFDIEIILKQITKIEIGKVPSKVNYIQNYEKLDLTGGVITVEYDDKTTDIISLTNEKVKVTGFDNSKIGTNTITVEYEGKTITFDVEIISKQISKIEIGKAPIKTKYIQNYEMLDLTGGVVTVEYNDGTTDTISATNEKVKVTGFDNSKIGTNTITIEYEGKTSTFDVEIISKQITKIQINKAPIKTKYIQNNENLDLTGGVITVEYDDKTTDTISLTNEKVKVTGFDNSKIGTNTITVEYEGKTTTFNIEIIPKREENVDKDNDETLKDDTIANESIPNAGVKRILLISIILILTISFTFYKNTKFKKMGL